MPQHTSQKNKQRKNMTSQRSEENKPKMNEPSPPDGGWGWVVCLASFVCNFLCVGINTSSGIFFVEMLNKFQESVTKTSIVIAVMNGLSMMISPLISAFLPFFSHRQIIIAGSLIGAVTIFASGFVSSIDIMILTFGIGGGVSSGMIFFASNVILSLYFNKRRGTAVGLSNAGAGLGTFVMNYSIERLFTIYALRGTLILLSGLVLNLSVFGALCRPLKYRRPSPKERDALVCEQNRETEFYQTGDNADDEKEDMLKTTREKSDTKQCGLDSYQKTYTYNHNCTQATPDFLKDNTSDYNGRCKSFRKFICSNWNFTLLKNSNTLMLVIIFFLYSANQMLMIYLPFYTVSVEMRLTDGVILMSIMGIGITVGELVTGILLDILHIKSDHLMTFSLILLSATTIIFPFLSDIYSLGFLTMIWSIAIGFGVSLRVLLIVELLGIEHFATAYSFVIFSNGLGYGILPIFFGLLYDISKSFHVIFDVTAAMFFVASLISLVITYQLRKKSSEKTSYPMNEVNSECM